MKAFITLAVVCLVAGASALDVKLSDEQTAKATVYYNECIKEENVSEEDAMKLKNKDLASPSKNMKCFSACFFEKAGTFKDNELQADVVMEKFGAIIGEEKTKAILEKCKSVKSDDRCDTAFALYECFETEKSKLVAA
uniref:Odorant-binding protein 13 n=1 Tax=Delia platura TaxID=81723 RepID=A0A0P0UWG4_9MUSC|nr:odorant-binding protein 13 [Delia platura]